MRVLRPKFAGFEHETLNQTGGRETERDQLNWCVGISVGKKERNLTQKGMSKADEGRAFRAHIEMPKG